MSETPWYLLFDGQSEDGRGQGTYLTRTKDEGIALAHLAKVKANPYSTGKVIKVTDTEYRDMRWM